MHTTKTVTPNQIFLIILATCCGIFLIGQILRPTAEATPTKNSCYRITSVYKTMTVDDLYYSDGVVIADDSDGTQFRISGNYVVQHPVMCH